MSCWGVKKDWKKYVVRTALRKLIRECYIDGCMPRILQKDPRYDGVCSFAISDKGRKEILGEGKTAEETIIQCARSVSHQHQHSNNGDNDRLDGRIYT